MVPFAFLNDDWRMPLGAQWANLLENFSGNAIEHG